jgi:hypothetical protein
VLEKKFDELFKQAKENPDKTRPSAISISDPLIDLDPLR